MTKGYLATRHDQRAAQMGVPVYITEIAVGVALSLYGPDHPTTAAFNRHNVRLHRLGFQGAIEKIHAKEQGTRT